MADSPDKEGKAFFLEQEQHVIEKVRVRKKREMAIDSNENVRKNLPDLKNIFF